MNKSKSKVVSHHSLEPQDKVEQSITRNLIALT